MSAPTVCREIGTPPHYELRNRGSARRRPSRVRVAARVAPALLMFYELRFLLTDLRPAAAGLITFAAHARCGTMALVVLSVIGVGRLMVATARGLPASIPRAGWSRALLRSWLLGSVVIGVGVSGFDVVHLGVGHASPLIPGLAGHGASLLAVLCAGLLVAVSLHGGRWLAAQLGHLSARVAIWRQLGLSHHTSHAGVDPITALLRVGWPDRGPPSRSLYA